MNASSEVHNLYVVVVPIGLYTHKMANSVCSDNCRSATTIFNGGRTLFVCKALEALKFVYTAKRQIIKFKLISSYRIFRLQTIKYDHRPIEHSRTVNLQVTDV